MRQQSGSGKDTLMVSEVAMVTAARKVVVPYCCHDNWKVDALGVRGVRNAKTNPVVYLVNLGENYRTIKKGELLANAFEVQHIICTCHADCNHTNMDLTTENISHTKTDRDPVAYYHSVQGTEELVNPNSSILREVPEHMQRLAVNSSKHQTEAQIEHSIDTGDAKPVKQRMRRTPASFAGVAVSYMNPCRCGHRLLCLSDGVLATGPSTRLQSRIHFRFPLLRIVWIRCRAVPGFQNWTPTAPTGRLRNQTGRRRRS